MRPSPFTADLQHLPPPAQRQRFRRVVLDAFVPGLRPGRQFRPELRQSPGGPALITQTGTPGQNPEDSAASRLLLHYRLDGRDTDSDLFQDRRHYV